MGPGEQVDEEKSARGRARAHAHQRGRFCSSAKVSQGVFKWRVQLCLCSGVMWSQAQPLKLRMDGIEGL